MRSWAKTETGAPFKVLISLITWCSNYPLNILILVNNIATNIWKCQAFCIYSWTNGTPIWCPHPVRELLCWWETCKNIKVLRGIKIKKVQGFIPEDFLRFGGKTDACNCPCLLSVDSFHLSFRLPFLVCVCVCVCVCLCFALQVMNSDPSLVNRLIGRVVKAST